MTYFPEDKTQLQKTLHEEFAENRELSTDEIVELLEDTLSQIEFGEFNPQNGTQEY